MLFETLIWVKSEDIYSENGEFIGTAPGQYVVAANRKEVEYWLNNGGVISDCWEDFYRTQYFEAGGDY